MKKIVILISGRGSNMEAIVRACEAQRWPARVAAVIANRADAQGLIFARSQGIAAVTVDSKTYPERALFEAALAEAIDSFTPDLIVLAGFMRVLTAAFVERYANRILNVHPSLLPSFRGLNTHQRALDSGVKIHGATAHFVNSELDGGPIIAQSVVPVMVDDDETTLAARVLASEHILYPRVVRWFIEDRLMLDGARVRLIPPDPQWLIAPEGSI
ncbi:phosphoribosylglycinamide formyltransferase [Mycoavidus sp. SF9855]|uniref:phosphoribosylglycinamide formyltransferase n=1 Tax=Mycoavidus sp. SF9855 TaxID=2968475 RepID=UPI00211CF982|nr:phosphoribosylglycinamide formyltransferase [Mycoavidus sp. SF9855]UUM21334.1 phosphoribosylglycinamide formyltransferase [Mycoavidus sp. SF9855]